MMTSKRETHTPEPWMVGGPDNSAATLITATGGDWVTKPEIVSCPHCALHQLTDANARRIVACVNACAGEETETLEQIDAGTIKRALSGLGTILARAGAAEALLSDWLPSLKAVHDGEYNEHTGKMVLTEDQWTGISEAAAAFRAFLKQDSSP